MGKTKRAVLKAIASTSLGQVIDSDINSQRLVEFALWRMTKAGGDAQPQTAANDLAHLGAVISVAKPAWGFQVDQHAMADARKVLKKLGYDMRSQERSRRPSKAELEKILEHFSAGQKTRPTSIKMVKVIGFAMFSTRRQDEITRIRWADLDEEEHRVLVRDMKNPGQKIGNNVWCHIPYPAWEILQTMPRKCDQIFPYNPDSISAAWTRACKFLALEDLHFHDLRHEGVSRLFEMEWGIPRVAAVSGHRDWNSMRRYTHLKRRGDVWLKWEWIEKMIKSPVSLGARAEVNVAPRRKHR